MNWVKENPFLAGFLALVIVALGVLGYFLNNAYTRFNEVSQEYDAQVAKLQNLQNRAPYPNSENIEAFTALAEEYQQEYQSLLAQLSGMQFELENITPQNFQDRLRAVVSEVEAAAAANNVKLPEDFYMGFGTYQGQLPSDEAAGPLARQLAAIKAIVDRLIEFRVDEIVAIDRKPLPQEGRAPVPTPTPRNNRNQRTPAQAAEPPKVTEAFPFDITFITEQGQLRQVLNSIVTSDKLFVIRNLTLANSQTEGPSRAGETTGAQPAYNPDGTVLEEQPAGLNVIVGRETLTVSARIEMVTVNPPTETAQPAAARR